MNKKAISRHFTNGTPQKRSLLLCNHFAASQSGEKPLLTDHEADEVIKSFKTERELDVYNSYRKMFDAVRFYLASIFQWRFKYLESFGQLEAIIFRQLTYGHMESMLNVLLSQIEPGVKHEKTKTHLINKYSNLPLLRILQDDGEEGIRIPKPQFELERLQELREEIKREQINFKTAITVIKDYLTRKKFNVKLYWALVKESENWAKSPKSPILMAGTPNLKLWRDSYWMEDDYKDVAIDPELYQQYLRDYFGE